MRHDSGRSRRLRCEPAENSCIASVGFTGGSIIESGVSTRPIPRLEADIEKRHQPKDDGEVSAITVGDQVYTDEKDDAARLVTELLCSGSTRAKKLALEDRFDMPIVMEFTERTQDISWAPDTMAHVLIQRLDSYAPRLGEVFPQKAELAEEMAKLEAIEIALAADQPPDGKKAA